MDKKAQICFPWTTCESHFKWKGDGGEEKRQERVETSRACGSGGGGVVN